LKELFLKLSEEDCIRVINVEESIVIDHLPAIKLVHLFEIFPRADLNTFEF
jgi:aspartate carbamoyltransferase regulatory subunit